MRITLDRAQTLALARFIVENADRIPEGVHLTTAEPMSASDAIIRVEGRGEDGKITDTAALWARRKGKDE